MVDMEEDSVDTEVVSVDMEVDMEDMVVDTEVDTEVMEAVKEVDGAVKNWFNDEDGAQCKKIVFQFLIFSGQSMKMGWLLLGQIKN